MHSVTLVNDKLKKMKPRNFNDLSAQEKSELINALENTTSMQQFWNIINERFQLATCVPNSMTRKMVSSSMVKMVLPMLNPIVKK